MTLIQASTKMSLEHFHDFYYLQALDAALISEMAQNPEIRFRHSVDRLVEDVREAIEVIVPNMAFRTFVYLYAASLGEARHARSTTVRERFLPQVSKNNRGECYESAPHFAPTKDNINALVDIFKQEWRSGFGGKPWQNIAEACRLYFTVPPAAFIDYVIDLEHNGGTAFNKTDASSTLYFTAQYPSELKSFLDYKFARNILEKPPQMPHALGVTRRVYKLVQRYCSLFGKKIPNWLEARLKPLGDYVVEWGTETLQTETKWREWVDVSAGNRPTFGSLSDIFGFDEIYPTNYTLKQWKKAVNKMFAEANKTAKPYMTKVLRKKLDNKKAELLQWGHNYCKPEKCKVTYSILPCKVRLLNGKLVFSIAFPYETIGKPTSYGFEIITSQYAPEYILEHPVNGYDGTKGWYDGHIERTYGGLQLLVDGYKLSIETKDLEALIS